MTSLSPRDDHPERIVRLLSPGEAQRLTQRIKLTASTIRDSLFKLRNLVEEAKGSNAWQVLGYQSWTAYLADTLADEPMRLGRDERQELVGYLSGEGLSTRAIAPIIGVDNKTVHNDIKRLTPPVEISTPHPVEPSPEADSSDAPRSDLGAASVGLVKHIMDAAERALAKVELAELGRGIISADRVPESLAPREFVAEFPSDIKPPAADDLRPAPEVVEPRIITGLDGKTYTAPAPQAPRRKALTDSARDLGWDFRKVAERLQRVKEDDRFSRNKEEVAALLKGHLMFTVEVCQDLLDEFNN